jgi:hypothetical protein
MRIDLAGQKRIDKAMLGDSGFQRVPLDQYFTEPWVTQALLDAVKFRGVIWEPASGRGDMVRVIEAAGYSVIASDIIGDVLGFTPAHRHDFFSPVLSRGINPYRPFSIVTNPPYKLAERFLRHALALTEPVGGQIAMLFRNEYDCAATRRDLFERPSFAAKLVLTRRPRWLDAKAQHSASPRHNFAWYLWDHWHSSPARIEWIPAASGDRGVTKRGDYFGKCSDGPPRTFS